MNIVIVKTRVLPVDHLPEVLKNLSAWRDVKFTVFPCVHAYMYNVRKEVAQ